MAPGWSEPAAVGDTAGMVMADRTDVPTSSAPVAVANLVGLAGQLAVGLGRVAFRRPWEGHGSAPRNLATAVTREEVRTFMGYASSLPIEEFRSVELVLDRLCRVVLPPFVRRYGVRTRDDVVAGVPCTWYEPDGVEDPGTILYLHGGGYIGTSPSMYAVYTASLARAAGCRVLVPDYRMAPEFPFPAGARDVMAVYEALLIEGHEAGRVILAGDSGGGGLACSVLYALLLAEVPRPGGMLLVSPEVDLRFDRPSIRENASRDILPWNIPTTAYLRGIDPADGAVDPIDADVSAWPPVFVVWGTEEMLRDQIRDFAAHLRDAGIEVSAVEAEGMFHVFPILMPGSPEARAALEVLTGFAARTVGAGALDR